MKAGRELDALIAEKVMGSDRDWRKYLELRPSWARGDKLTDDEYMVVLLGGELPHYSTQIADAWLVVEQHQDAEIEHEYGGHTRVVLNKAGVGWFSAFADTAPLAICLSALKASDDV